MPRLPLPRISARMHAGHDYDGVLVATVEQTAGETSEPVSTGIAMKNRVCLWILNNPAESLPQSGEEIQPQCRLFTLIPTECVLDIVRGRRAYDQLHEESAWRRRRTSSHGIPVGPSRSISTSLRSNSAR